MTISQENQVKFSLLKAESRDLTAITAFPSVGMMSRIQIYQLSQTEVRQSLSHRRREYKDSGDGSTPHTIRAFVDALEWNQIS